MPVGGKEEGASGEEAGAGSLPRVSWAAAGEPATK
jgi:hypothetical protein